MAVGVHALLHERRVAEHEVQECRCSLRGVCVAVTLERGLERGLGVGRAETQSVGAEHQLCPVAVGEEGVADAARGGQHVGIVAGDACGDPVRQLCQELLLAREVPVESARLDIEPARDPPHRQIRETDLVEEGQCRTGDTAAVVARGVVLWVHVVSIVNTVQVNSVQEGAGDMTQQRDDLGRELARVAIFAALIVVLGTVTIPIPGGVPITAQTLGVMLAGAVLGPRLAPLSVLLVLVLAAIGLPVLAGGRGGLGVFVGPTAGYLLGWVAGVIVIGLIVGSGRRSWWRVALGVVVGGILVVYLCGIPVTALVLGLDLGSTALASLVFLPGDLLKAAAATGLVLALRRAYPRAFGVSATAVPASVRAI